MHFEKYTDRARRMIVDAQNIARIYDSQEIGTEHLLLALVKEVKGVAGKALQQCGVEYETLVAQALQISSPRHTSKSGALSFSARTKKALEFAVSEANILGDNFINTEHLLLGLIKEGGGVGILALAQIGVEPQQLRRDLLNLMRQR